MPNKLILLLIPVLMGCSGISSNPLGMGDAEIPPQVVGQAINNRWLWGQYNFHINADHTNVGIIPLRQPQYHYNVKTLLENGPCYNCIWITHFKNNGDSTVNLGVALRHPYPGDYYYTGFDVRGIVHFPAHDKIFKYESPQWLRCIPSKETGDPELLNKDGYNYMWWVLNAPLDNTPKIRQYQPGGKLGGGISWGYYGEWAHVLNPFKYYYSSENRRYFLPSDVIIQNYHIYIPPGEWDFGYSVDACWAPPLNNSVTKVPDDFPIWANSMADYRVDVEVIGEINGDNPATLVVDVYNYLGSYALDTVKVFGDIFKYPGFIQIVLTGDNPVDMGAYARWVIKIHNSNNVDPGWYRLAVGSTINDNKFPVKADPYDVCNRAAPMQIVKVHVVS